MGRGSARGPGNSGGWERIADAPGADEGEGSEAVRLGAPGAEDIGHEDAAGEEGIRDEGTMAAPGDGLGAQDRGSFPLRQFDEPRETFLEIRRLHVIGEAAKRGIAPSHIGGIAAGRAQAAELGQMDVAYFDSAQPFAQGEAVELRIMPGAGNAADVDDALDAVGAQKGEEVLPGAGGMPKGKNRKHPG